MINIDEVQGITDELKNHLKTIQANHSDEDMKVFIRILKGNAARASRNPLHPPGETIHSIDMIEILEAVVANRDLVILDDSHKQSRMLQNAWANIDEPKKYDFEDDDENYQTFMRYLRPEGFATKFKTENGEDAYQWKSLWSCSECAEPVHQRLVGNIISFHSHKACEDHSNFKIRVDFPTGELLVVDCEEKLWRWKNTVPEFDELPSVNQQRGTHLTTDLFASHNIAHFFVGNTSPGVYLTEDGKIVIRPDEHVLLEEYDDGEFNPSEEFLNPRLLTNICTDLWWATLVDKTTWQKLVGKLSHSKKENPPDLEKSWDYLKKSGYVISIPPGIWEFHVQEVIIDGEPRRRFTGVQVTE